MPIRRPKSPPARVQADLRAHFPETRENGLVWPLAQLVVVERYGLLYRPVAKSACSSLKRMMVSLSDIPNKELMLAGNIHDAIDLYRTGAKLLDLDRDRALEIVASPAFYRFAVVRDPFERLVSAYVEKFVVNRSTAGNKRHTGPVIAAIQRSDVPDFDRGISFEQFVHYVVAQDPMSLDPHWRPQSLYLHGVTYDRVYRMDELEMLQRDISARVGHGVTLEHRNRVQAERTRFVPGSAHRLPSQLPSPKRTDKASFMESELMFRIGTYFADDYRLYYGD